MDSSRIVSGTDVPSPSADRSTINTTTSGVAGAAGAGKVFRLASRPAWRRDAQGACDARDDLSDRADPVCDGRAGIDAVVLRLAENIVLTTDWYVQISGLGLVVIGRSGGADAARARLRGRGGRSGLAGDIRTFPAIRNDGPHTGAEISTPPRRPRARARRDRRRRRLRGKLRDDRARFDVRRAERRRPADAGALQGDVRDRAAQRRQRAARVDPLGQDRARPRATAPHQRDRGLRPERLQGGGRARRDARSRCSPRSSTRSRCRATATRARAGCAASARSSRARAGGGLEVLARAHAPDRARRRRHARARHGRRRRTGRITRARVCAGSASPRLAEAYDVMREPRRARASPRRSPASRATRSTGRRARSAPTPGFTQFPHHTGHGTGFRYHESRPQLVPGGTDVVQAGQRDHHRAGDLLGRDRRRRPPRGQCRRRRRRAPSCLRRPSFPFDLS